VQIDLGGRKYQMGCIPGEGSQSLLPHMAPDIFDNGLGRSARRENFCDAASFQGGNVLFGNNTASDDENIVNVLLFEQLHDPGKNDVVGAREDRQPDTVDVLLKSGVHDLFGRLSQPGVNHLHSGIAEGAGHNFSAAVVAIKAGLGYENSESSIGHSYRGIPWKSGRTAPG
jgi:hypothetical protein